MRPWPQARQVSSSSAGGATDDEGTGPVQPTSSGDSSPAGAVCGVADASRAPSAPAVGAEPAVPSGEPVTSREPAPELAAARAETTRSAPHASQKVAPTGFAVPHTGQSRENPSVPLGAAPAGASVVGSAAGSACGAPVV